MDEAIGLKRRGGAATFKKTKEKKGDFMPKITQEASASLNGDLLKGKGTTSTAGDALHDLPYSFHSRFEQGAGTNPEELIAAANASCFSMALAKGSADQGHVAEKITTAASLTLMKSASGFKVTRIHLHTIGLVPVIDQALFRMTADQTKENCPISVLLKPGLESITLEATLK